MAVFPWGPAEALGTQSHNSEEEIDPHLLSELSGEAPECGLGTPHLPDPRQRLGMRGPATCGLGPHVVHGLEISLIRPSREMTPSPECGLLAASGVLAKKMFWKGLDKFCYISLLSNCSDLVGGLTCQRDARGRRSAGEPALLSTYCVQVPLSTSQPSHLMAGTALGRRVDCCYCVD